MMKWTFAIEQKTKAALLLCSIMVLLVLNSFLSKMNIDSIHKSVTSIYNDRLIPAIELIQLTEGLYRKRLLLDEFLSTASSTSTQDAVRAENARIDSLLNAYEKTYLVAQETTSFDGLKQHLSTYSKQEQRIIRAKIRGEDAIALGLFEKESKQAFQESIKHLHELATIQSDVGEELRKSAQHEVSQFNLLSNLQIVISIIIGILILNLIYSTKIITKKGPQNFNLN